MVIFHSYVSLPEGIIQLLLNPIESENQQGVSEKPLQLPNSSKFQILIRHTLWKNPIPLILNTLLETLV